MRSGLVLLFWLLVGYARADRLDLSCEDPDAEVTLAHYAGLESRRIWNYTGEMPDPTQEPLLIYHQGSFFNQLDGTGALGLRYHDMLGAPLNSKLGSQTCTEWRIYFNNQWDKFLGNASRACGNETTGCYSLEANKCLTCPQRCTRCLYDGRHSTCTQCPRGSQLNVAGTKCMSKKCGRADQCTECAPGLVGFRNASKAGTSYKCHHMCPPRHYQTSEEVPVCLPCHELCDRCFGPTIEHCYEARGKRTVEDPCPYCDVGYFWYRGYCKKQCPVGTAPARDPNFKGAMVCLPCRGLCANCTFPKDYPVREVITDGLELINDDPKRTFFIFTADPQPACHDAKPKFCQLGEYMTAEKECLPCHEYCLEGCDGGGPANCYLCRDFRDIKGICVDECIGGTIVAIARDGQRSCFPPPEYMPDAHKVYEFRATYPNTTYVTVIFIVVLASIIHIYLIGDLEKKMQQQVGEKDFSNAHINPYNQQFIHQQAYNRALIDWALTDSFAANKKVERAESKPVVQPEEPRSWCGSPITGWIGDYWHLPAFRNVPLDGPDCIDIDKMPILTRPMLDKTQYEDVMICMEPAEGGLTPFASWPHEHYSLEALVSGIYIFGEDLAGI
ncbi:unnamed protein product, partial [Mesorhabditis spiculigera]